MNAITNPARQDHVALAQQAQPSPALTVLSSDQLFGGERTIAIAHEGMIYTLRITRQGKLLLTK